MLMVKKVTIAAIAVIGFVSAANAAPCHDAKGKFIKCPPTKTAPAKTARCKDTKGKFAKCGTPGAKPA